MLNRPAHEDLQYWVPIPPDSSADVVVLIFLTIVALISLKSLSAIKSRDKRTKQRLTHLTEITSQLDRADMRSSRGSALAEAEAHATPDDVTHLWKEFDETLVDDRGQGSVQNTVDAREVFNTESLAFGLVHSKGLGFIPSALTAIGVLGTFIGLALGLQGLQIGGETEADITELQTGIQQLISGVSTAFLTSIFGVVGSLLVSFYRFLKISRRTHDIEQFQTTVDALFERHTPEQSLVGIEQSSADSLIALNELHEKIGSKLQEAVHGMATDMQEAVTSALQDSIAPALETLSSASSNQAATALDSLLDKFDSSFREFGNTQAERLSEATAGLSASAESIDAKLTSTISAFAKQNEETGRIMQNAVTETTAQLHDHQKALTDQATAMIEVMQQEREHSLEVTAELSRLVSASTESMKSSSQALSSSSRDVRTAADHWEKSAKQMDERRQSFTRDFEHIVEAQQRSVTQLNSHETKLREVAAGILEATETFRDAAEHNKSAVQDIRQSQSQFLKEQLANVESLRSQMRDWLEDYSAHVSSQTSQRMDEWNQHSREYATNMHEIAAGLADMMEHLSTAKNGRTDHP